MEVDVVTEVEIGRPRADVAAYAMDPDNATIWYRNITGVEWKSPRPLRVGSKIAFVAKFDLLTANEQWVKVPLPFDRLKVSAMSLDGAPATINEA